MYSLFLFLSLACLARAAARARARRARALGALGRARRCSTVAAHPYGVAPARRPGRVRARSRGATASGEAALAGVAVLVARHPVLAHRPRPRGPVRRRRRRRRREARRARGRSRVPLAIGRRLRRRLVARARSSCSSLALVGLVLDPPRRRARSSSASVGVTVAAFLARAARRLGGAGVAAPDLRPPAASRSRSRRRSSASRGGSAAVAVVADGGARRPRGRVGLAPHAAALRVGARRAPGGAGRGRGLARARRAAPTTSSSATSRSTSAPGSATDSLPDDRRPARRRRARAPDARARATPLGRGVWVLDASERNNLKPRARDRAAAARARRAVRDARLRAVPRPADARAGRDARDATSTAAARALLVGRSLGIGDADVNMQTVVLAGARAARLRAVAALPLEQLAVARRALEGGEARPGRRAPAAAARRRSPAATAEAPTMPPSTNDRTAVAAPTPRRAPRRPRPCDDRRTMRVVSLGDLVLDVVVRIGARSRRAPTRPSRIALSAGGQGANVAAWVRGARRGGALARQARRRRRGTARGDAAARARGRAGRPGRAGRERASSSRSSTSPASARCSPTAASRSTLRPDEIEPEWLECDHLHVSGLRAARASRSPSAATRAVELARERARGSASTSRRGARSATSAPSGFRALVEALAPDVVFANEDEDASSAARLPGVAWILKRGARGCSFDGDERAALPVAEVVDTTGAGDALAAGWIVGGPDLALEAAARCVQRSGRCRSAGLARRPDGAPARHAAHDSRHGSARPSR